MPSVSISTALSDRDRRAIISGVVEALKPLIEGRPELVPTDTMSVIAGLSPATLDRLRRAGKIPSCKVGNRRLYRPGAVIAAIESMNETGGDQQ
jgi:hypothetical protein